METHILEILNSASEEELWRAAEAVVEAAVYRRALYGLRPFSAEEREILVHEIVADPSLISSLFSGAGTFH